MRKACSDCASLPKTIGVSVNLSASQFKSAPIDELVLNALASADLSPRRLQLEITESAMFASEEDARVQISRLRSMGVVIAMDDFGTGYSCLNYLRRFPFDKVKIDKCFLQDFDRSNGVRRMLRAILEMARILDLDATVEGVETPEQLAEARACGASEIQGFLFGRPMPLAQVRQYLKKRERL